MARSQVRPLVTVMLSNGGDWWDIATPFNQKFVDDIKSTFSSAVRSWNPNNKKWSVRVTYEDELRTLLTRHWHPDYVRWLGKPQPTPTQPPPQPQTTSAPIGSSAFADALREAAEIKTVLENDDFWIKAASPPPPPRPDTHYTFLGVEQTATAEEIKRAYRIKAMALHPDRNKAPDAKEQFLKLKEIYATLKDPNRRKRYDLALKLTNPLNGLQSREQEMPF